MTMLKPLISQLIKVIKEGYDLGRKELPKVAQELIKYTVWINYTYIIILNFVFSLSLRIGFVFTYIAIFESHKRWGEPNWGPVVLCTFLSVIALLFIGFCISQLMKAKLAPRVFLLETLKGYLD